MIRIERKIALALLGLIAAGPSSPAGEIRVVAETAPATLHRAGVAGAPIQVDPRIEASAVEPIGDGRFVLVAHDKASEFYVVEATTGRIVGEAMTTQALPATSAAGPKWEAMARDSKGNYYAMGSHSGKTGPERAERAHLVRFRFRDGSKPGEVPEVDPASVRRFEAAGSLASALAKDSGDVAKLKVEGLAVREISEEGGKPARIELVVGLREPADLVRGFVAEVAPDQAAGSMISFERLFAFEAGLREGVPATLTSLTYVPAWRGFFILTASEDKENIFHGNTLWFLGDREIATSGLSRPERAYDFEAAMKAEGLADLPEPAPTRSSIRMVVAFDNDAKSTHVPSKIQVLRVTRPESRD